MRDLVKAALAVLVLSLSLAAPVAAGPFEDGVAAYEREDYATALRLLRPLAEQGEASAQFNLGFMYDLGQGVPQDYAEAVKWYRKAADQGNAAAQYNLGLMYDNGHGVPQDYAEAVKWYRKAAERGVATAQNNLGFMYGNGQGVPQDYVQAHKWYNLAGARFPASETENRNKAVENRDLVAALMTPAQIAEAQKLAREWKPK
jgi:TPR repeat protein